MMEKKKYGNMKNLSKKKRSSQAVKWSRGAEEHTRGKKKCCGKTAKHHQKKNRNASDDSTTIRALGRRRRPALASVEPVLGRARDDPFASL
jgi:hypothetical protein